MGAIWKVFGRIVESTWKDMERIWIAMGGLWKDIRKLMDV
jgi:hypothetical protein